ncbi:peptidase M24 family protein [Tieghemostelium lacteum]|uniref:Peptidase M24 family protein n=1 Tax=Tieghemostelium lacteum TaxID=361077 RepID=A0A151ZCS7_TIELA|nr:peptidase M24 family protein [Tieghemostelium lacteum]|eukprot:KYQ91757.1 peptidase M24 family protein [Tieghemostelium lacteum]
MFGSILKRMVNLKVPIKTKVNALRGLMQKQNLDAYIVPSEDQHQSEYISLKDKRREYISGFTGSSGCALITLDKALLWTDGRYWLQADHQLDKDIWVVMKDRVAGEPTISDWLCSNIKPQGRIGIDSKLISNASFEDMSNQLQVSGKGFQLVTPSDNNLVDEVREQFKDQEEVPQYPLTEVFYLDTKYSGKSSEDKISAIREDLKKSQADYIVVSALDEIAWLFNLRGSDISFNPVFLSYAIVSQQGTAQLFINEKKLNSNVRQHLPKGTEILDYSHIFETIRQLDKSGKKIWLDPKSSLALYECVSKENLHEQSSPITMAKSLKNPVEMEGFRQCHIRDGAALVQFLAWLEDEIMVQNITSHTECSVADKLEEFRRKQDLFVSLSFDTISGMGSNGAIIHYKPDPETCKNISKGMYLVDSGAQYFDGTTDVTRTVYFGNPTQHEIDCYTRVLKGHLGISLLKFPARVTGRDIDSVARMVLWEQGLDYAHGTGHGVGSFLNVHEGPQSLSQRQNINVALKPGMTLTNEPGYYETGKFGIRIENVMLTVPATTAFNNGTFNTFENITLCPYERKLMNMQMLNNQEITFINNYYKEIRQKLSPLLQSDPLATKWLQENTTPLSLHLIN